MFRFSRLLLVCLILAALAAAQSTPPPLIDRELFFGDPEISGARLSPDGKYIAFMKPWNDTRNIWVKKTEEPFDAARRVTAETKRPIPAFFWSWDSKYLLYVQDKDGDENYNIWSVSPSAAPPAGAEVPEARNLTNVQGVRAQIYAQPRSDADLLYIGLNDRDKAWHDLYKLKISTGETTLLRRNTERLMGWVFDNKDQLRLAVRSADNGDIETLRVDPAGFQKIYSCDVLEQCFPARFSKDNSKVYMMTNRGERNLAGLTLLDPATGKEELVEEDPQKRVDLGFPMFSEKTDELVATFYEDDRTRIYWKNKDFEKDYEWLIKRLPGKEVRAGSSSRDENLWLVSAFADTEPGESYLFDRKAKKLTLQYRVREGINRDHLSKMEPIRYESSDGMEIPGFLTLPKGYPAKDLPVIVNPHGGPWARSNWGYNGMAQFLANRGYAVLQPNFRASTGYGKKFLNAGNRQWGDKMQDDITWGVKYLAQKGIADPKRIGIMGGSYGGYATLAGVAFTPDLYAAGVAIVAPSNLITLMASIPPYWEAGRKMFHQRMGDPNTEEGKAQLVRQSPLTSAGKIKTPLLVAQGANDPRVNQAESDQIVIALRDRDFPVEYLVAPDEGHGFARPVNNMALMMSAEKFLAKHLGGRFQEGGKPEVVARLKEITVDPKTVVLAAKVDPSSVSAPKPARELAAGVSKYQAKLSMGPNEMKLSLSTEIKEENGAWKVTDTMAGPMGEATDVAVIEKGTLVLRNRTLKQGPATVNLDYRNGKATGSMSMNGQEKPIDVELGGPVFADSAGSGQSIAALPLKDGYTVTFRNFDIMSQKPKLMQLKVTGSESVTVPAGSFDAYKVEITNAEGGPEKITFWIAKDAPKPVKMAAVMPQMGGATMSAELEP
ncbi:MAG: prolyl oligopeptidase family serine peptidase [Bryobacteraceae bacterium]|nr:prolyl oligopeptidase family serine peptidase [Bryobacteraceae bacterium]